MRPDAPTFGANAPAHGDLPLPVRRPERPCVVTRLRVCLPQPAAGWNIRCNRWPVRCAVGPSNTRRPAFSAITRSARFRDQPGLVQAHDKRCSSAPSPGSEQVEHIDAQDRVQVADGFVGQDQIRLLHHGPGDRDTLPLAAAQTIGALRCVAWSASPTFSIVFATIRQSFSENRPASDSQGLLRPSRPMRTLSRTLARSTSAKF